MHRMFYHSLKYIGSLNGTGSLAPSKNSTTESLPIAEKTIEDGKHDCTSTKEVTDMIYCNVSPPDDDAIIERNSNTTGIAAKNVDISKIIPCTKIKSYLYFKESPSTTTVANNKTEASTESQVTKVTPQESNEKESGNKTLETDVVLLHHSETTEKGSYDVVPTEANHSIHISESGKQIFLVW